MTLTASNTLAQSQARQNLLSNLSALDRTQPNVRPWVEEMHLDVEWVFARDRELSALDENGHWLAGCSLPRRAAESMLKTLDVRGAVAGFLSPTHAAQIAVALEKMRPEQAVIALIPEIRDLATILHCHDFTQALNSHRLWFAAGSAWEIALQKIFEDHPGLATPTQFIRMPDADATLLEQLIGAAQKVFSDVGTSRSALLQDLRQSASSIQTDKPRICIVAPSRFRLWNDLGETMVRLFDGQDQIDAAAFDADDPTNSSPLALLQAARQCSAIFTANTTRTDLPGLIPETIPWITWATTARIPSSALAAVDDYLIVVDPMSKDAAVKSGWPDSRVHLGIWPQARPFKAGAPKRELLIIADTSPLDTPDDLIDYSSHMILWESIRQELSRDPFVLTDLNKFLNERMKRQGIGEEAFVRGRFIEKLMIPAYQQSLARILLRAKVPLKLYGQGWNELDEFKPFAKGSLQSRDELRDLISNTTAIIHPWPTTFSHPVDSFGVPIVRAARQRSVETFLREAQAALNGKLSVATSNIPAISADLIHRILRHSV